MGEYRESLIIDGNSTGAEAALDRVSSKVSSTASAWTSNLGTAGKSLDNVGRKMQAVGRSATMYLTLPLLAAGGAAIKLAMDAETTRAEVSNVFGEMAGDILSWSETSIEKMGMATQTAQDMATQFAVLFQAAGLGGKAVAGMSKEFVQLTSDVASFYKIPLDDALAAVRSGLTGSGKLLRKYGVFITDATIQGEAMRIGLIEGGKASDEAVAAQLDLIEAQRDYNTAVKENGKGSLEAKQALVDVKDAQNEVEEAVSGVNVEMTNQEKILARASLIQAGMSRTSGAFAKGADEAAVKTRIMWESLKELGAELGEKLLPIFTDVVDVVSDAVGLFSSLDDGTQKLILQAGLAAAAFGPLLMVFGGLARGIGGVLSGGAKLAGWLGDIGSASSGAGEQLTLFDTGSEKAKFFSKSLSGAGVAATGLAVGLPLVGLAAASMAMDAMDAASALADVEEQMKATGSASKAFADYNETAGDESDQSGLVEHLKSVGEMFGIGQTEATTYGNTISAMGDQVQVSVAKQREELAALAGVEVEPLAQDLERLYLQAQELDDAGYHDQADEVRGVADSFANAAGVATTAEMQFIEQLTRSSSATEGQKKELAGLMGSYRRTEGSLKGLDMELLKYRLANGQVGAALRQMRGEVNKSSAAFGKQINRVLQSKQAQQKWGSALTNTSKLTKKQTLETAKWIRALEASGKKLTEHEQGMLDAAIAAGKEADIVNILTKALGDVPKFVKSLIKVETGQATSSIKFVQDALSWIDGFTANATVNVDTKLPPNNPKIPGIMGQGGIQSFGQGGLVAAAGGMIARGPVTLVGEGRYATPVGRGGEWIQPLDSHGVSILGDIVGTALERRGIGGQQGVKVIVFAPPYKEWRGAVMEAVEGEMAGTVRIPRR